LAELRSAEIRRLANQQEYADKLAALENGQKTNKTPVPDPVKRVVFVKGELQMENGLPKLEVVQDKTGNAMKPYQAQLKEQAGLNAALLKEQEEIRKLAAEAASLTDRVQELFREIERAAQVRQGSGEERRYLEQILYNVQVEAALLEERQKELEARLNELKGVRVTSQGP